MSTIRCIRPVATRLSGNAVPRLKPRQYSTPTASTFDHILVSSPKPGVGMITLNRPKALNALSTPLMQDLNNALKAFEEDSTTGAVVLTGSEKAFAAGADIKEMAPLSFSAAYSNDFLTSWTTLTSTFTKPLLSAVSGYCLGGGCELAMMTDIIYCTSSATFGQPEVKLGVIPGAGGSQRLTRAVGKSRAMELILTGKNWSGKEAGEWGLAARVFEGAEECVQAAVETAGVIAGYSRVPVKAAKEVINKSQDAGVRDGVEFERRLFHGLFGSQDQKIGMKAFVEKKKPQWTNE